MRALQLQGHYGKTVEIDLCPACHLVWFDSIEPARLAGAGLLALVGEMAAAQQLPHHALAGQPPCPRCRGPVRAAHNLTRWGRSLHLECQQRHGAWQSFREFLAEKGLLRAQTSADRQRALQRDGALRCVNCGGDFGPADTLCPWCTSTPALVDVARLARALDPEDAAAGHAVRGTATRSTALHCAACGAPQPAEPGWQCVACGATLAATGLAEAHRAVQALGPTLRAHAEKPLQHVVQQRLAAQQPALDRQRARARQSLRESEVREALVPWPDDPEPPRRLRDWFEGFSPLAVAVLLGLILVLLVGVLIRR